MTATVVAALAAVGFFLLLLAGARVKFGISRLPARARPVALGFAGFGVPWLVYGAVRLLDQAHVLRPLGAFADAHRRAGLLATVPATVLGFALFMGGVLHLALSSGPSEGFRLAELAAAVRSGAWLRSGRWRRRVVVVAGVGLFAAGLFGTGMVLAPPGVKLLLAAGLLYAAGMTLVGIART